MANSRERLIMRINLRELTCELSGRKKIMDLSDNNHVSSTINLNEANYENGQPETKHDEPTYYKDDDDYPAMISSTTSSNPKDIKSMSPNSECDENYDAHQNETERLNPTEMKKHLRDLKRKMRHVKNKIKSLKDRKKSNKTKTAESTRPKRNRRQTDVYLYQYQ